MRHSGLWPMLIFCALVFGCARSSHPHGVAVRGHISENMLAAIIRETPTDLQISSPGGDGKTALDLGLYVQAHHVNVGIVGLCGSGCAQYVFAAAQHRWASPNSVLGFHNTAVAMKALVANDPDENVRTFYDRDADQEVSLYQSVSLDRRLLVWPVYRMDVICYVVQPASADHPFDVEVRARHLGWIGAAGVLRGMGLDFRGTLPTTFSQLSERLMRIDPSVAPTRFVFDDTSPNLSFQAIVSQLQTHSRCPTE